MGYSDYKCFQFGFDSGIAFVSINHPPINLLDEVLSAEFDRLGRELEADESVRVVVVQSALPDFFIAHSGLGRVGAARKPPVYMQPGDVFEVEIEGMGILSNPIQRES